MLFLRSYLHRKYVLLLMFYYPLYLFPSVLWHGCVYCYIPWIWYNLKTLAASTRLLVQWAYSWDSAIVGRLLWLYSLYFIFDQSTVYSLYLIFDQSTFSLHNWLIVVEQQVLPVHSVIVMDSRPVAVCLYSEPGVKTKRRCGAATGVGFKLKLYCRSIHDPVVMECWACRRCGLWVRVVDLEAC